MRNIRNRAGICVVGLFILLAFVSRNVFSMPPFVETIPNGDVNKCSNCHVAGNPPAKKIFTPFGKDYHANMHSSSLRWNTALAKKDSDGDGLTNGQELGDPEGTWKKGGAIKTEKVYNPGDSKSHK